MINGIDFHSLEAQKYWSFAKSYKGDPKAEAQNMIFSGEYLGSRKMDGEKGDTPAQAKAGTIRFHNNVFAGMDIIGSDA